MAHPVASSASLQIPALESQHTGDVSSKEPKPQKQKKSKTAPASQSPLEVRSHATVIACYLTHYSSHQLQPPPGFFDHRVKIFEGLRAEYNTFVQGLFLSPHTGINLTIPSTTTSGNYYYVTRWRRAQRHKLGDQSDGCCEGHIQESV
jgi:threonyl-tRNA synthetase